MTAIAQDFWQEQADEPQISVEGRINAALEDAYWQGAYFAEPYYRDECSYDDYAPAYCVGYIGYAQYGGKFDEAEKSLCANWVRIKGDSCLTIDEAMQAIRAAWEHAAQSQADAEEDTDELVESAFMASQGQAANQPVYATA